MGSIAFVVTVFAEFLAAAYYGQKRSSAKDAQNALGILQAMIEGASDAIFLKDLQGRYLMINSAGARFLGKPVKEVLGKDDTHFFPPEMARKIMADDRRVMTSRNSLSFEEVTTINGAECVYSSEKAPYFDNQKRVIGLIGTARDITQRKRSEEALRESEERFKAVFFASDVGMSIIAPDGRYLEVNQALCDTLGYPAEEMKRLFFTNVTHPDDVQMSLGFFKQMLAGDMRTHRFEKRYIRKDGRVVWTLQNIALVLGPNGSQKYFVAQTQDITERKRIEEERQVSETRFRKLFEESPISIQILSPNGRTLKVNRAWKELLNVSQNLIDQFVLKEYNILEDPQLVARGIMPYIQRGFKGETLSIPPIPYNPGEAGRPGRSRWMEPFIYAIKDTAGQVREVILMHRDITERKEAERTLSLLAETSSFLGASLDSRAIFETATQLGIKHLGGSCVIHAVNADTHQIERVADAHSEPESRKRVHALQKRVPPTLDAHDGPGKVIRTNQSEYGPQFLEMSVDQQAEKTKGKAYLSALLELGFESYVCVPLKIRDRVFGAITFLSADQPYTERDLALARELSYRAGSALDNAHHFNEAQKAIRLRDEFLSVASHELKTPITPLSIQIQTLKRLADSGELARFPPERFAKMIGTSYRQLQTLSELIDNLLDVTRIQGGKLVLEKEEIELTQIVRGVVERFAEQLLEAKCPIEIKAPAHVTGDWDRLRIEQVITNLLGNAIKYGGGAPIEISIEKSGERARLSVRDFGIGIAKEDQLRIFNPFERAVSIYRFRGLGLGLHITKEIVEAHGGSIHVESELGQGSLFVVELPLKRMKWRRGRRGDLSR